jgi:hypothetical protein
MLQLIGKDFLEKQKLSKKLEKETINPDIKRIIIFSIKIRPGRPPLAGD